jgi:hypothetical protein
LLIEGEAGMGKTALWQRGVSSARERGFQAIVARPVETEAEWSFTTLVDLLQPVADEVSAQLPEPQQRALETALLLRAAVGEPDPRALGTAVLNALRASPSPLVVAVDDVQWVDSSTHAGLAFAARSVDLASPWILHEGTHRSG